MNEDVVSGDSIGNAGQGRRVLLVEDEVLVSLLIEDILTSAGCDVVGPAARVDAALQLISEAEALDAAVLDVNIGGEMVFPVATALRSKGVPFIFVTGYGAAGVGESFPDVPVLAKPCTPDRLLKALATIDSSPADG